MNNFKWKIINITLITIILIYSIVFIYLLNNLGHIRENWNQYKCNPFYAPFAGFIIKDKDDGIFEASSKNMGKCLWITSKSFFKILIKPFMYIISIITALLKQIQGVLDKFRMQLIVIRKMLLSIVTAVMNRLQNLLAMFIFTFLKLRDTIKRTYATFKMMVFMLETTAMTFSSMINGPVGDMVKMASTFGYMMTYFLMGPISFGMFPSIWAPVLCFSPEFKLKINEKYVNIKDIRLGDFLENNNRVTGYHYFLNLNQQIYQLNDEFITGEHLVLFENKWIPVNQHPNSKKSEKIIPEVICLSTSKNKIIGKTHIFKDWDEFSNLNFCKEYKEKILSSLNKQITNYSKSHLYQECFYFPELSQNQSQVPLGEKFLDNYIIGKSLFHHNNIKWYKPRIPNKTNIKFWVSGSTLVYYPIKKIWQPVYLDNRFEKINEIKKIGVHYTTLTGNINIGTFTFKDLLELRDTNFNCWYKIHRNSHL